jgi:hypothetical protein
MTIKAFPTAHDKHLQEGMDLRDYFAAKAMQGLYSDPEIAMTIEQTAMYAYKVADAMMDARK